jgi:sarcosine oxidase subunit beta
VPEKDEEALRNNILMHQKIGIPSLLVTPDDVKRLAPHFHTDDFNIAAYEPESGYADPNAAATSLMGAAKGLGARLIQDCALREIQLASGKVTGVSTSQGKFSAPIIVNAAGAWAKEVAAMVNVELPITTWRHDVMYVKNPVSVPENSPTVIDNIHSMYFRPETGGLTLVGLEDNNPLGESPEGYTDRAQPGFVERAIDRICKRIPAMEAGDLHSDNGGYDGISKDQRAVLGQIGPEGFYCQCGFSGTGFKIAPAVGLCMSELIVYGAAKTVDITPFDPNRFARGELLKGENAYDDIWH